MALPTKTELSFQIDLECDEAGSWSGSIDMPSQGLRGFKLSGVEVNDQTVAFTISGVPGEPTFSGKLSDGGQTMNGVSTQGGQSYPVRLERKPRSPASVETPPKGIPGEGLVGYWNGLLKVNAAIDLRLGLEIENSATNGVEGAMVSLDQGNTRSPISVVSERGGLVHLEFQKIGARFDGRMNTNRSELAGEWKQSGQTLPATFHRMAKPLTLNRPQEPKQPFPYSEENVTITNLSAGIILAGTLSMPRKAGPHPAVVLIAGTCPQDRDEAIMGHRPFRVLADHLSRNGIAVLRYDKRGIGGSSGNFAQATYLDFVEDTKCCMNYLRMRKGIDPKSIGMIGHSEGGIIAPQVAVQSPDVAFIVLLAG
ncbi:MAG: alpha/beta hydrolase family protein, partial [Limisphaerales bacterium]